MSRERNGLQYNKYPFSLVKAGIIFAVAAQDPSNPAFTLSLYLNSDIMEAYLSGFQRSAGSDKAHVKQEY